jgi:uncharacterized protein YdeI (YjbR/CyaY-like superfamily)
MVGPARRVRHPVPVFIRRALADARVEEEYAARPPYQRNDYIGWIMQAKREETRQRRLRQMLDELEKGGVYMKMDHPPSRKS